jgi:hypothetical protein
MVALPDDLGVLQAYRPDLSSGSPEDVAHFVKLWSLHTEALANNVYQVYIPRELIKTFRPHVNLQLIASKVS